MRNLVSLLLTAAMPQLLAGLAASKTIYRTADGQHAVSVRERYSYDIIEPSPFAFRQKALSLQNVYSDGGSMGKAAELSL